MFSSSSTSLSIAFAWVSFISQVSAHANIIFPPTRESKALSGNSIGFPLNGPSARPGGSCTKMSPVPATPIKPGKHILRFFFNNNANHVGMCKIYLADANAISSGYDQYSGEVVGEMKDCGQSLYGQGGTPDGTDLPGAMEYTIPENPKCGDKCVLIWTLRAVHISESNPEFYDGCADIKIDPSAAVDAAETAPPMVRQQGTGRTSPFSDYVAKKGAKYGPMHGAVTGGKAPDSGYKKDESATPAVASGTVPQSTPASSYSSGSSAGTVSQSTPASSYSSGSSTAKPKKCRSKKH